ncbi:hypothetical protein M5689_023981 [Euphorbia peplus]|nr:hypothetical protein M5689_023981 [Euphorbia peplus]
MMTFCKKSVHSFLGLSFPLHHLDSDFKFKTSSSTSGIGLISATGDFNKTPNVLESTTVLTRSSSCPLPQPPKKDPGGIGFIDDVGGGVDGLMSCTESLGFESCDERRVDDEIEICCTSNGNGVHARSKSYSCPARVSKICGRRKEVRKFPPPLTSLNHNGQPCFFLQPVRKDGRLELMEVRIDRPEILRASRQDGRLRLHLIRDGNLVEEKQVEEDEEMNEIQEGEAAEEEEEEEEIIDEEEVEKEVERNEEWRFPVAGEGLMRCHEAVVHHHDYHRNHHHQHNNHHHNLHVWSQHCVTTS